MNTPTLRIARIQAGWSQAQLATVCDVSAITISNLEIGKHSPQELTRKQIEIALGTVIDWQGTKDEAIIRQNGNRKALAR